MLGLGFNKRGLKAEVLRNMIRVRTLTHLILELLISNWLVSLHKLILHTMCDEPADNVLGIQPPNYNRPRARAALRKWSNSGTNNAALDYTPTYPDLILT